MAEASGLPEGVPAPLPASGPLDDVTCVSGETFCISGPNGEISRGGQHGLFIRDTRVVDALVLRINGAKLLSLAGRSTGTSTARFTGTMWPTHEQRRDPLVLVDRRRVISESLWEEICLTNFASSDVILDVELAVGTDFAYIFDVKHGQPPAPVSATLDIGGLHFARPEERLEAYLRPNPPSDDGDEAGILRWLVRLGARERWATTLAVGFTDRHRTVWPTRTWAMDERPAQRLNQHWSPLQVSASESRLSDLVRQSVEDLASLVVEDDEHPGEAYIAAGSPWYLTLFGRDALWSAFTALPLSVELAGRTLRALARRQGTEHDRESEMAPGKILHEMRHGGLSGRGPMTPLYYGSIDATPLFVTLLNEAWRWGLPGAEVEELLPAAERALEWMVDEGDSDGDGLLEYTPSGRSGLTNQGWKDSDDGVQFADGRLAAPPVALCEVQGYAHQAAVRGTELLAAFDRPASRDWSAWAANLRQRFRETFWVDDDEPYPAVALDGLKRKADSVASNMGHLPLTGLLDEEECARVARRLTGPDMDCGWGLRTLSSTALRFNPLSYHGGSVWPHDTAIAVYNLAASGHGYEAAALMGGLVAAAPFFGYRLPELFAGEQRIPGDFPIPYPAACRPQAWSAGAALLLVRAAVGIHPHVPDGRLLLQPLWPPPYQRLRLQGLHLAGGTLSVTVDRDVGVTVEEAPEGLEINVVIGDH